MAYSAGLVILSTALVAMVMFPLVYADILPPGGSTWIPYEVEIASMPNSKHFSLAIFPWGDSNGRPDANIAFVEQRKPLGFGRRILGGEPKFWAVHADKVVEIDSVRAKGDNDPFTFTPFLEEWLKSSQNAVECTGARIQPRFRASEEAPGEAQIVDRFIVRSLDANGCDMEGPLDSYSIEPQRKYDVESFTRNGALPRAQETSWWSSWGFSIAALSAVFALVWRLSNGLQKRGVSQAPVPE